MKRLIAVLLLSLIILTSCAPAPGEPLDETPLSVDSSSLLSAQVGFTVTQPADSRNHAFSIINDVIAQMEFSYMGMNFTFRGSMIYSGQSLYGMFDNFESSQTEILSDESEATYSIFKDGACIITWYDSGVHKSLYCKRTLDKSILVQLAEQL